MRQGLRSNLTYANVISTLALFLVLGGGAYAATGGNFILGKSNSASTPTSLSSGASQALKVTNTTAHAGVWAAGGSAANNAAAVHGQSSAGNAVEGISGKNTASGVYGQSNSTGFGVAGRSTNGTGIMGDSSGGWAVQAFGHAKQTRTGGGFVKAMAFVDHEFPSDPIRQCFNSQRPAGQATSGNCGLSSTRNAPGRYAVDFNFQVYDRFVSVTGYYPGYSITAQFNDDTFLVWSSNAANQAADSPFWIIVY